jgi:eukaryotic-like serine/threonine-protein kinase
VDDIFPILPADFGRYRILRRLGAGGMGAVYLAEDTKLRNRKTAIKIPTRKLDDANAARFQREAEAAAVLEHPHICTVYDVGSIDGRQYLAMKFVEGRPLSDGVGKGRLWQPELAVRMIVKLANTLQFAHEKGVIHRDIKPANIMLTANGEPILMDFGLAKVSGDPTMTQAGSVFGTPNYMPLEQARGDTKKIGPHSDVYSLGVILFQMLTGTLPFTGDSAMDVFAKIAMDDVPTLRESLPDVDEQLEAVCARAMAKQAKDRYATMREFADALTGCPHSVLHTLPAYPHSSGNLSLSEPVEFNKTLIPLIQPMQPMQSDQESQKPRSTTMEPMPSRGKFLWLAGFLVVAVVGLSLWGLKLNEQPKDKLAVVTPSTKATALPPEEKATSVPAPEPKKEPVPAPEVKKPPVTESQNALPTVIPKPAEDDSGEKTVSFEYMIDGVEKQGTCRVLTLDIGGGQTMEFVRISKGKFTMGSPENEVERRNNEAQKEVTIDKDFYLARYETTQAQYQSVMGENPSQFKGDRLPVETVSWEDAKKFCSALSKKLGRGVELPKEAEWEYAGRAGTTTPFHFGSQLNGDLANCNGNRPYGVVAKGRYLEKTADVGSYPANPWGLHDMHGNVWEWCEDKYSNNNERRVLRGGAWIYDPEDCRVAGPQQVRAG